MLGVLGTILQKCRVLETSGSLEEVLGEGPGSWVTVNCAPGLTATTFWLTDSHLNGRVGAPSRGELATPGCLARAPPVAFSLQCLFSPNTPWNMAVVLLDMASKEIQYRLYSVCAVTHSEALPDKWRKKPWTAAERTAFQCPLSSATERGPASLPASKEKQTGCLLGVWLSSPDLQGLLIFF